MPKVSIIIPVYNVEEYLKRCLDSVLCQTLSDIEIILVDDGSTDSSGKLCDAIAKQDERIKVIHKENRGLSSARNEGLKYATSDLVGFIDSDDWITHDMYEYLYSLQQKHNADIVSCGYVLASVYSTKIHNSKIKEFVFTRDEALLNYIERGLYNRINDYSAWKKIYKKELFSDIEFPKGVLFEDMPTNFRLIQKSSKYVYSTKKCYFYFQNSVSITRNQYSLRHNDLIKVTKFINEYSKSEDEKIKKIAKLLITKAYFSLLTKIVRFGKKEDITDDYIHENLLKPFKEGYKDFIKSNFSLSYKILAYLYNNNWEYTKRFFSIFKK